MRIRARLAFIALAGVTMANAPASALAASPSFPMSLRGDWFVASKDCADARVAIRVEQNAIRYFDEFWMRKLLRVVRQNARGMTVLAEYAAEGHQWNERVDFQFLSDRRSLTVTRNSIRDESLRERCAINVAPCPRRTIDADH